MVATAPNPDRASLDDFVERFEEARLQNKPVRLSDFLPPRQQAIYLPVLRELIRVDLEYGWGRGQPRSIEEYQREFPDLFRDPDSLQEIAFEEYRLRKQAGEKPLLIEYQQRFGFQPPTGWLCDPPAAPAPACDGADEMARTARKYHNIRQDGELGSWFAAVAGKSVSARLFQDVHGSDPQAAERLAQAVTSFPEAGSDFLGFHLIEELGRGAFGRVYLAHQGDLANRPVALKVSTDLFGESQTLAQLQQTNIVPIYSIHHALPFQAVCMPYFGSTTLATVLREMRGKVGLHQSGKGLVSTLTNSIRSTKKRPAPKQPPVTNPERGPEADGPCEVPVLVKMLETMTYVEAVLWMAARLGEGLTHAHERGILHRDLKPANILLTDEGQPMLLDFNLSADTKLQGQAAAALIGGTLPYMAPEHLEAFDDGLRPVDARSDIYALGVILFEMLAGAQPFATPRGPLPYVLGRMITDRSRRAPSLRARNPAVTPAVESIVMRCLAPDPEQRYQSAAELVEDLDRQRTNQPLRYAREPSLRERARKWVRRHPRLTSATGVAAMAGVVVLVLASLLVWHRHHRVRLEARGAFQQFDSDAHSVKFELAADPVLGKEKLGRLLERYRVMNEPAWQQLPAVARLEASDQARLRETVAQMLLLSARMHLEDADAALGAERKTAALRSALDLNQRAEACFTEQSAPRALWLQRAALKDSLGLPGEARELRQTAAKAAVQTAGQHWLHAGELPPAEALPLLEKAIRLDAQNLWAWFDLALAHEKLGQDSDAAGCFGTCTALAPRFAILYLKRGQACYRMHKYSQALEDFDQALRLSPDLELAALDRARALGAVGRVDDALKALDELVQKHPRDPVPLLLRAEFLARKGDRAGAKATRKAALELTPADEQGWLMRGEHRLPDDPQGALADFDQALKRHPRSLKGHQNKAHVLAEKMGQPEQAVAVLDQAVAYHPENVLARAGRGVLLARSGKRDAALQDARECLKRSKQPMQPMTLYQVGCIYALTSRLKPADATEALQLIGEALRAGYGIDLAETDVDLAPLRARPELASMIEVAKKGRATP